MYITLDEMMLTDSEAGGEPAVVDKIGRHSSSSREGQLLSYSQFQDVHKADETNTVKDTAISINGDKLDKSELKTSDNFSTYNYGYQMRGMYEHSKKCTDVMAMTYNGRMHQFIMLDTKGITTWNKDAVNSAVTRSLNYPKYEYRLFKDIIYARKYNVYFVLCKDFSLKVLNRDFEETCSSSADLRSVLFMTFNSARDELITGGVDGTRIWKFKQATEQNWGAIKEMANYYLSLERHIKSTNDRWVRKVILEQTLQHLYYCSDTDLICYHMDDSSKPAFTIEKAHKMSITGCCYSASVRLLVTSSVDCEVKAWSMTGGLIHTFRGHTKSVTDVLIHPDDNSLVITCSLDGTVRTWSLNTMTCIYSLQVSSDGVRHMGLTDDRLLYLGTSRTVAVWSVGLVASFWAHSRSQLSSLQLVQGARKSTRLVAVGDDGSVRVFSRPSHKNLSTVLPPPSVSPLEKVKQIVYNRVMNIVYVLINERDLWLYTSKTDPACRLIVWNLVKIQKKLLSEMNENDGNSSKKNPKRNMSTKSFGHRATEFGLGNEVFSNVTCIGCLDASVEIWTAEGLHSPDQQNFLMLGLEDGRILFMDPVIEGQKIFEFRANKNSIIDMRQNVSPTLLVTLCNGIGMEHFQFWSLPSFDLLYEVSVLAAVSHYAFLEERLMTGHADGAVRVHDMVKFDTHQSKTPVWKNYDKSAAPEHNGPITAVDACPEMRLFLTCSADGSLKIWDISKVLLTEINLDSTLSCACFFNSNADVVVGFQNQIFIIDSKKVCPHLSPGEGHDTPSDIESEIHEDPAVLFEGVERDSDIVNMRNYLRHFKEDVINDYVTEAEIFQIENEDFYNRGDPASLVSPAPTELYRSQQSTPARLSEVDLKLSAHLRQGDIKDLFAEQEARDVSRRETFELPQFGLSPGPTPTPSTPSTPRTPTSVLVVSEGGESTETEFEIEEDEMVTIAPEEVKGEKTEEKSDRASEKVTKVKEGKAPTTVFEHKGRAADIVIDAEAVLKGEAIRIKKTSVAKMSEPSQSVGSASVPPSSQGSRASSAATIKKKQLEGPRKRPKAKELVEPEIESPPATVQSMMEKKLPPPRRRTKGFLEKESELETKSSNKYADKKNFEFQSRRHEVDISSVIEKLEEPLPTTERESSSPQPTLITQDINFQSLPAPKKQNKMVGKKVRSTSKPKAVIPRKSGKLKQTKTENGFNLLRKSKSEEGTAPLDSYQQKIQSVDVVLPTAYPLPRKLSSEAADSTPFTDLQELKYEGSRSRSVPLSEGLPPQFDTRSRTPGFLLDDDSEWTIMMDSAASQVGQDESRRRYSRPSTSFGGQRRPYTPAERLIRPSRPEIEHFQELFNLSRGDMKVNFVEELQKYRGIPGTEDYVDNLHKNDGLYFENSWHEKAITRHILLRLQRELRAKSAVEKRKKVDAEKCMQQTKLSYHRDCSTPAPEGFSRQWKKERAQTAPLSKEHRVPLARPNTAVSVMGDMPRSESTDQVSLLQRNQLSAELPFRIRLNLTEPAIETSPKISAEEIDLHMYDPRNDAARAFLLSPSKSIPSRCSRYILVTQEDKRNALLATPLEERLIEERFPGHYDHWIPQPEAPKLIRNPYRPSTAF